MWVQRDAGRLAHRRDRCAAGAGDGGSRPAARASLRWGHSGALVGSRIRSAALPRLASCCAIRALSCCSPLLPPALYGRPHCQAGGRDCGAWAAVERDRRRQSGVPCGTAASRSRSAPTASSSRRRHRPRHHRPRPRRRTAAPARRTRPMPSAPSARPARGRHAGYWSATARRPPQPRRAPRHLSC